MFNKLWTEMKEKMNIYEQEPPMLPIKRYISQNSVASSENFDFTTAKHRFKAIYFETLDTLVGELDERFKQPGLERVRILEDALLLDPEEWSSAKDILSLYEVNFAI
ncbi:hypothetical protein PR048_006495 [Dryococelus australis]|uniref:Uncharacterized protein n=1 Tax=Dryococelus australis TaxID=614101 RepID=A0ABQ9IB47_9NEOP|nr:hypothetical protein PR048_006495 [Dryococelus australis]